MWQKIYTDAQLNKIVVGKIVIKYPVTGNPVEELNLLDTKNLLRYEVHSISETDELGLKIPEEDIPNPSEILGIGKVTGIMNNPPILHKAKIDLLKDGVWWIKNE